MGQPYANLIISILAILAILISSIQLPVAFVSNIYGAIPPPNLRTIFIEYENPIVGIRIQYPHTWDIEHNIFWERSERGENGSSSTVTATNEEYTIDRTINGSRNDFGKQSVRFEFPAVDEYDTNLARLDIIAIPIGEQNNDCCAFYPSANVTLIETSKGMIQYLKSHYSNLTLSPVYNSTLGNFPAVTLDYEYNDTMFGPMAVEEIAFLTGTEDDESRVFYDIVATTRPESMGSTQSVIIDMMLDSFEVMDNQTRISLIKSLSEKLDMSNDRYMLLLDAD
jgi:hypothetical protein